MGVYVVKKPFVFLLCLVVSVLSNRLSAQGVATPEVKGAQAVEIQDLKETLQVPQVSGVPTLPDEEKPLAQETDRVPSESLLPASTTAWVSIPDVKTMAEQFRQTNIGRLSKDPDMKPFIDSLTEQFRNWANKKNLRLGLTIDDISELNPGEIAVAGILPPDGGDEGEPLGRRSHGIVILVDVDRSTEKAQELVNSVNQKMKKAGAKQVEIVPIKDVEVSKWSWKHVDKKNIARHHTTLQAIVDGWLVASDNETIFRDVVRRIKNGEAVAGLDRLSNHPQFMRIAEETRVEGCESHFRWFVDPFGYLKLAKAIAAEDQVFKQREDSIADILEQQGFDAIKGIGGTVSFPNGERDLVHRTFAHMPRQNGEAQKRARGILDFQNQWKHDLAPEPWAIGNSSSYMTFTWNVEAAFQNIGKVFDAFIHPEEPGDWDQFVEGFKRDLQVDLRDLVTKVDNRFSMMSASQPPISEDCERIIVGIRVKEELESVFGMVERMIGPDGEIQMIGGRKVIVVDTPDSEDETEGPLFQIPDDPVFGGGEEQEQDQEDEPEFNLFAKRYFVAVPAPNGAPGGYILLCNNAEYLTEVLDDTAKLVESELNQAPDYKRVQKALSTMVDPQRIGVQQFGRIDKILQTNYEMLRQGKMAQSQTVLARVLNEMFKEGDDEVREQKIDGNKMPQNYAKDVAPYLGPSGWAMESYTDGWRISGLILKKNGVSEVVQKQEDEKKARR